MDNIQEGTNSVNRNHLDIGVFVIAALHNVDIGKSRVERSSGLVSSLSHKATTLEFDRDAGGDITSFRIFQPGIYKSCNVTYDNGIPSKIDGRTIHCDTSLKPNIEDW